MTEPEDMGYVAQVVPELAGLVRPLGDAKTHPDNARDHRIELIAQSLQTFGQRAPIVVQASTGLIVKGNGTYEAAKLLGWDAIAQTWQEMGDDEAMAFLFADNRTSDLASYKREKLLRGLQRLFDGPGITDSLWEPRELEDLRDEFTEITELPDQGAGEDEGLTGEEKAAAADKLRGEKLHEMSLLLNDGDYREFALWVQTLQKEWGLKGITDTIVLAVKYAVEHIVVHKEPEPEDARVEVEGRTDAQLKPLPITEEDPDENFPI